MSKESRAAKKEKLKAEQAQIKRVREREGSWASFKLACKIDWQNFLEMPWWKKPIRVLRLCITIPISLLILLVMFVGFCFVAFISLIVIAFMEHFWESFAFTCLALLVIVLFATGVF